MALFSRNKKETAANADEVATKKPQVSNALPTDKNLAQVLLKPRITEKAVMLGDKNVYTFIINPEATKRDVSAAVKAQFNVTPMRVNIVKKAPRKTHSRRLGRTVSESGMKKAYVYLKDGDSISIV